MGEDVSPMQRADSDQPSLAADIVGGVTTFVTMAYVVVVNPTILATAGTGLAFSGVLTATVLVAARPGISGNGSVLSPLLLHRAAGVGRPGVRHCPGARAGGAGNVPDIS